MKPAMFGKKGERILFLLCFVLFSTMNREHVGATSAVLSEKPLKLDMSAAKSEDIVLHLKLLDTDTLKFTAQRPSDSCLTENREDNKVEYKHSDNCKMLFGWTNKIFVMNTTNLVFLITKHDVLLSFGTTAKVMESSTGTLMDVKGFCKFLPKKTGSFHTAKFTILRNKKPPSCPIVIIFDDSVQLDHESNSTDDSSMMPWLGGGLAVLFVVAIIVVITGYFVWKRKKDSKEKSEIAEKPNQSKRKKSKDGMKKQSKDNKTDQSNANAESDHSAFPVVLTLSDGKLPKSSQPQVIPAKPISADDNSSTTKTDLRSITALAFIPVKKP